MPGEPGIFSLEHKYCTVQNARCPLPQKTQFIAAVDTLGLALPQRAPGPDTTVILFAPLLIYTYGAARLQPRLQLLSGRSGKESETFIKEVYSCLNRCSKLPTDKERSVDRS